MSRRHQETLAEIAPLDGPALGRHPVAPVQACDLCGTLTPTAWLQPEAYQEWDALCPRCFCRAHAHSWEVHARAQRHAAAQDAAAALARFDQAWWLANCHRTEGRLVVDSQLEGTP